ncbi:MAG: hypothetical protein ACOC0V_02485, partial [Oceanicaulis sp.]
MKTSILAGAFAALAVTGTASAQDASAFDGQRIYAGVGYSYVNVDYGNVLGLTEAESETLIADGW